MRITYPSNRKRLNRWVLSQVKLIPFAHLFKYRSYSQKFEDILISNLVGDQIGSYVDVGSGLPCFGSNTYFFYKRGWRGILIDPIPRNISLSKFFRRGDICFNIGVGEVNGVMDFYHINPYELSTFDPSLAEQRIQNEFANLRKIVQVQVRPLSEILSSVVLQKPVVLSVDTEGFEIQVLKGIDWTSFRPEIICIEEFENPIHYSTQVKLFLENLGYILTFYTGLSSIYVFEGDSF